MSLRWRLEDSAGTEIAATGGLEPDGFCDQFDAEEWFSQQWEDLRASGVDQVTLLQQDDASSGAESVVYGPMSLHS